MSNFLSSLVGNIREILKVLGISRSSVKRESLELGARDSSLFGSLSFLNQMPVVASFSSRLASVALLSAVCFAAQVMQAQPALPIPQATALPGGVARPQMNLNVQIRDLCFVLGARDNQLVGYGIVSGLAGDGDKDPDYTLQAISNMLERFGLTLPPSALTSKNIAAVILTADIPPFVRSGSRIDVHVSAMGDARSLHGAVLARTPLMGPDGKIYAVAQGAGCRGRIHRRHPRAGWCQHTEKPPHQRADRSWSCGGKGDSGFVRP